MEHAKPSFISPAYQAPPMPMPMPMPPQQPVYQQMAHPLAPKAMMTMPMHMHMPAPVVEKPVHTDIHLHSSYQQTTFLVPPPRPKLLKIHGYSNIGSVLVLFILLVIITRSFC